MEPRIDRLSAIAALTASISYRQIQISRSSLQGCAVEAQATQNITLK
jgi:hypothetical protein